MDDESGIHTRFKMLAPFLNERTRRVFTAAEAAALGRAGHRHGRAWDRGLSPGHRYGVGRITCPPSRLCPRRPPPWRRSEAGRTDRSDPPRRPGAVDRPGDPGRPRVAAAVDAQECAEVGGGTPPPGARDQPSHGCRTAPRPWL